MTNDIKDMKADLEWFFYFLLTDLEVKDEFVKEFGEGTVRKVCMDNAIRRIESYCKEEGIDVDRAREFAEGRTSKSNEQTDDFDGNPLTVV